MGESVSPLSFELFGRTSVNFLRHMSGMRSVSRIRVLSHVRTRDLAPDLSGLGRARLVAVDI